MTYRAIDKRRFSYLLSLGTDEVELRKFFSDSRIQLIQRGARVQNLPNGDKARVRMLAFDLPTGTDEVVRTWFAQHVTMSDPESPQTIVETFKLHEDVGEQVEEETARRLSRSCLVHLFSESIPSSLLDFLKTPVGGVEKIDEQAPEAISAGKPLSAENLAQVLFDLVQGHDVDKHLEGLPTDLAALAIGLQSAAQGKFKEAHEALESLSANAAGRAQLDQFLKQQEVRGQKEPPRGPIDTPLEDFDGPFDFETDEILGYCTNSDPPRAVFVHPIAVVRVGSTWLLSSELRRNLFPDTGDLMAFARAGYPRQPRRREFGIWRVEEHQTDKATHFHISGEARRVYELFAVPFPSTDYDSVREYIKEHAERTANNLLQPPLFVLSDGLIVGSRPERLDLTKEDTFEAGLLMWKTLPALRLEGRLFTLGPLPKEQGSYECASLASSVRKLLRPHIGSGNKSSLGLTKAQLSELVQILSSSEVELSAMRLQRIRGELEQIDQNQEALSALVKELFAHASVKQRVEELIQIEVDKQIAEKGQVQADIARLQRERSDWEERIRKQQKEHRKLAEDTGKIVRAAFEKARTDGVATLAELAIFQELTTPAGQRTEDSKGLSNSFQPIVRPLIKTTAGVIEILRSLAIPNQNASAFAATGELAFKVGLILCIRGVAARLVVERWAQTLGDGFLVDSSVGLLDDKPFRTILNGSPSPDSIAVLDANLSALDIYARPLSDSVLDSISRRDVTRPTSILFAMSDGVGSLPMPLSFERLSISIDLDAKYDFSDSDPANLMEEAFDVEEGALRRRLWRPAAEKLRSELTKLDQQTQALVLPVLRLQ